MGRKGVAWIIIGVLITTLIGLIVIKSDSFISANSLGGSEHRKWNEESLKGHGTDKIVQLTMEGVIAEQTGGLMGGGGLNAADFISQLEQTRLDEDVKAVVIRVNSPGGEVVASDEIHSKILELKQAGKPVIVSMGSVAASGGYYISAPADYIFANPATMTGSLGVIFSVGNYEKAADWLGYTENTIKSGAYKDIGSPLREMTPEEQQILQTLVDESYQQFVTIIEKGRNLPREKVLQIADGRIYTGQQAKALGLVDEFGTLETATNHAAKKAGVQEYELVRYSKEPSFSDLFSGAMVKSANPGAEMLKEILPDASIGPKLMYLYQS
ncbi:signal peptide peptidase SppA [Paenibacillus xerothermodurans]|uniref:Signal peptide peptidase SppA n=1 Tax=Paenibacillus xerothermodurans TaxID=1977292 RepID=A0A2W1NAA9_PAEXE|nr:signal peptide peptidase SppA [Paenibacillus xerothermodurans]PZE21317.1 signal peptide peptidase SppA [Paenibacillus xerothermodurans]